MNALYLVLCSGSRWSATPDVARAQQPPAPAPAPKPSAASGEAQSPQPGRHASVAQPQPSRPFPEGAKFASQTPSASPQDPPRAKVSTARVQALKRRRSPS